MNKDKAGTLQIHQTWRETIFERQRPLNACAVPLHALIAIHHLLVPTLGYNDIDASVAAANVAVAANALSHRSAVAAHDAAARPAKHTRSTKNNKMSGGKNNKMKGTRFNHNKKMNTDAQGCCSTCNGAANFQKTDRNAHDNEGRKRGRRSAPTLHVQAQSGCLPPLQPPSSIWPRRPAPTPPQSAAQ